MCAVCDAKKSQVFDFKKAMKSWQQQADVVNDYLEKAFFDHGFKVDEIALLFATPTDLGNFLIKAVETEGVTLFNHSKDEVVTSPLLSEYSVEYFFFRMEGSPIRVEAMIMVDGHSPIHTARARQVWQEDPTTEALAFHLSFKCEPDNYDYAVDVLSNDGKMLQSCHSMYGDFAYFDIPIQGLRNLYVKPRRNMRDTDLADPSDSDRGEFGMPTVGQDIPNNPNA